MNIYLRSGVTESLIIKITLKTDTWKLASVNLPKCTSQFQLVFEGVRGLSNNSIIDIDDIRFVNCEYEKPNGTCQSNQFKCSSNHCISTFDICDLSKIIRFLKFKNLIWK